MNWRVVVENILIFIILPLIMVWLLSCTFVKIEGDGATVTTQKKVDSNKIKIPEKVFPP